MESYGGRLRRIRGNTGKQAFAQALGITVQALNAYESGKRLPRDEVKRRVEAYVRCPRNYFLRRECTNSA